MKSVFLAVFLASFLEVDAGENLPRTKMGVMRSF
jgi:hypothetical protein